MSAPAPSPDSRAQDQSVAAQALAVAGDLDQARDVGALDDAAAAAGRRLGRVKRSLVERLIYGPVPEPAELGSGAHISQDAATRGEGVLGAALGCLARGEAFGADGKLSGELRQAVSAENGYGFTVPAEFGGLGGSYPELAVVEETMSAHGLGPLAVEISGELTIGAGSLLGYGTPEQQSLYLPMLVEGRLMAFALTEVGIGVNAKKVQAYVERDEQSGGWRLFAGGARNKLWITNATHGALAGLVARIGEGGKQVGLFVIELPEQDVERSAEHDYEFRCEPSQVDAFQPNHNSRIHFDNFPIPDANRIEADGVEVLFYCLRMGRCMLAAMAAGYQRMFAADAAEYARQRDGVGGKVIKHELPRLALGKMLGGALQARALSHLSLQQDADGVDLAGLRDLTKSASATAALDSLIACERVLGGRSFDERSRVNAARANMHVFGVVEGEDDLILMGMVKDITATFTNQCMAGLLGVIQSINVDADGKPLPKEQRILRLGPSTLLRYPGRFLKAMVKTVTNPGFLRLAGWLVKETGVELLSLPKRLLPASMFERYRCLPQPLQRRAKWAEQRLRDQRWVYWWINTWFQLDLTRAQIPLQRFGKRIEHLVSIVVLCHHAAAQDESQQRVATLQCTLLRDRYQALPVLRSFKQLDRLRAAVAAVGEDIEQQRSSLLDGVVPEPFSHRWD